MMLDLQTRCSICIHAAWFRNVYCVNDARFANTLLDFVYTPLDLETSAVWMMLDLQCWILTVKTRHTIVPNHLFLFKWNGSYLSFYVPLVDSSCFDSLFRFTVLRNDCSFLWVPFHRICSFLLACGTIVPNHLFLFMWNGSYFSFYVPLVDSSCFDSLFRWNVLRNDCSYQWVPFCWHAERLFLITGSYSCEMVLIHHFVFL